MSDFSKINDEVQQQLSSQAPAPAPPAAAPATPAIEQAPAPPTETELLRDEVERLKSQAAATEQQHQADLATARTKAIVDSALNAPVVRMNCGQQDAAISAIVHKITNFRWHQLTPEKRCEAIGIYGSEQVADKTCRQYFGPNTSEAAVQLQRSNPLEYLRLRGIARCRGIA